MEFKGTKGEWVISKRNIELQTLEDGSEVFDAIDIQCDNKNIVLVPTDWSKQEAESNAKLIAQSPNMLSLLNKINYFIKANKDKNYMVELLYREVEELDDLITKATE